MKGTQRLLHVLLPVVGALLVAAMVVYWTGAGQGIAPLLVPAAFGAAALALAAAWWRGRSVTTRIQRLARAVAAQRGRSVAGATPVSDQLDEIETQLRGLDTAVSAARDEATRREVAADARASEYAALIDDLARLLAARLQDAQLPLHILLSSPFGTLNENQEEMLGAAKAAVDIVDQEVQRLRKLLEIDRGALRPVPRAIGLAELLRPVVAIGAARASATQVQLRTSIAGDAPRVVVDAMLAQEALTTILDRAIAAAPPASDVTLEAHEIDGGRVAITVDHPAPCPGDALDMRLARRLLTAQGATLDETAGRTVVSMLAEGLVRVRS